MSDSIWNHLNRPDVDKLAHDFQSARPTRFFSVDDFLRPEFAREVASSYPSYEDATRSGRRIDWVNERVKVQISDSALFPPPVARLNQLLHSPEFMDVVAKISGIPRLLPDPALAGAGMHLMGPGGHLDLHVDFNMLKTSGLHRRLNILVYLTPDWADAWDGSFQLWDADTTRCEHSFLPRFNRCVMFNTTESSFHAVNAIDCPQGRTRNSFAAYYYTAEPPEGWDGKFHSTIYRARPDERWKRNVLMPAERLWRRLLERHPRLLGRFRRDPH